MIDAIRLTKSSLKLALACVVLLMVVGAVKTQSASAYSSSYINSHLENGISSAQVWDNNCRARLREHPNATFASGNPNLRDMFNTPGNGTVAASYHMDVWISERGHPNTSNPITVLEGSKTVPMQVNGVDFLCRTMIKKDLSNGCTKTNVSAQQLLNASGWVTATNANDSAPNPTGGGCMQPAKDGDATEYRSIKVSGNAEGHVANFSGPDIVRTSRDNGSRYWFANHNVNFNYVADSSKGFTIDQTVRFEVVYRQISSYYGTTFRCRAPGGTISVSGPTAFGNCGDQTAYYTVRIHIQPVNHDPAGRIGTVSCDANNGGLTVPVTFSDADGNTSARVKIGSVTRSVASSPGEAHFSSSEVDPYRQQTITLYVRDVGSQGDGNYHSVDTATTKTCVTAECGNFTISPTDVDPYTKFSMTVSIRISIGTRPPPRDEFTLSIVPVAPASWSYQETATSVDFDAGTQVVSKTFNNIGPSNEAGNYKINWQFTNSTDPGLNTQCGADFGMDSANFWIANKPYLSVYGGNTVAGGNQQADAVGCQIKPNAGIFSWNNDKPDYAGAGGQLGVMALGLIKHFISGFGGSNGTSTPAHNSFANSANVGGGTYGGKFGAVPGTCDFIGDAAQTGTDPGNTIGTTSVAVGSHKTYYVTGHDVYISGNVTYAGTNSWNSTEDIPSFKLVVVGGNIYINGSVGELDGMYAAVPGTGGKGGQIVTCASSSGPVSLNSASMFGDCNHKLDVYGAFAAADVMFNRTWSSLGAAKGSDTWGSNHAAETFIYSPEMWLPNGSAPKKVNYDSIIGLPPVL